MVEVLVRKNVSSMVPAAPSDPKRAILSWDGWHVAVATVVLAGAAVVEAPVPVVAVALVVVVVEPREVDVLELDELLVHAPSADPATRAATAIAAARAVIRMVLLLHTPA
jgi:hypothetical protein